MCYVPRRLMRSSRKPRAFVNGGAFGRVRSLIPCRFATPTKLPVLGPGALLEVILATTQRNKMVLALPGASTGLRISKRSRLGWYGAWLDSRGWRTRRISVQASNPKATEVEECVGAIAVSPQHGATLLAGTPSKEGRATLMGLRRAVAGTAARGHSFLSLTDNMSSLLVCDRGR